MCPLALALSFMFRFFDFLLEVARRESCWLDRWSDEIVVDDASMTGYWCAEDIAYQPELEL